MSDSFDPRTMKRDSGVLLYRMYGDSPVLLFGNMSNERGVPGRMRWRSFSGQESLTSLKLSVRPAGASEFHIPVNLHY